MLFDFGASTTKTIGGTPPEPIYWNNVTDGLGAVEGNTLANLVTTNNTPTDISILIVSRFNGSNDSGTQTGNTNYPPTATRDSLFGNTGAFGAGENIFPVFKLTGLAAGTTYTLNLYASRTGVTDNRETRYTVTGATEEIRDLNVANNITNRATVTALAADANGEITIALTPGPNNNNPNTFFTYLGILQIDTSTGERLLVDFGAGGQQTLAGNEPPSLSWNNVDETIGGSATGVLTDLVTTNGTPTAMAFRMVSRFNTFNSGGTTASTLYPVTATQDSLFGNTEVFGAPTNVNIFPSFKLTGLDPTFVYNFSFYASRTGVGDNRETRYTVTGTNTVVGDLNPSNNTNNTVSVNGIRPTPEGEITIAMTPGPNNNNAANHFTYLGVMRVDFELYRDPRILIDFGADGRPSNATLDLEGRAWNNVTAAIGSNTNSGIANLNMTGGSPSGIGLKIVSRFNGANENGTEFSSLNYPIDATRDSLYGNTGEFGAGLSNIFPVFKLTNLVANRSYKLTMYASRAGVGDNRETRYTVTGDSTQIRDYQVANNVDEVAVFESVLPDANREITIALTPGPNNDNGATLFTYLGILDIEYSNTTIVRPEFSEPSYANGNFTVKVTGAVGKTYKIQRTADFSDWTDTGVSVTLTAPTGTAVIPQTESHMFYRAVEQP